MHGTVWRRATRCGQQACVEVAAGDSAVLMRDSKDPDGPILTLTTGQFGDLLAAVKAGEFDRPQGV